MAIASGSNQRSVIKEQTGLGVYSATGGQILRRTGLGISFKRNTIDNDQIRNDKMSSMPRGGLGMTEFSYDDLVTPGSHSLLYQAITLGTFATAPTTGAQTNITAALTATPVGTFTRGTGSFLTDGFRRYQVGRWTGWTTGGATNNARNFLVLDVTATVLTGMFLDGTPVAAKAAGDSVTFTLTGKQAQTPLTGHVDRYFQFEDWSSEVPASERSFDTRVESCNFSFAPDANATVQFGLKGLFFESNASAYFSSPTAAASTDVTATATGVVSINGARVGLVTTASVNVTCTLDMPKVIGSNRYPFAGSTKVDVTGNIGIIWDSQAYQDAYQNETDLDFGFVFASGSAANAEFVGIALPRCRLFSAEKSRGIETTVKTYELRGAENGAAAAGRTNSVVAIQDSLAP
jgi:hypothetical protein